MNKIEEAFASIPESGRKDEILKNILKENQKERNKNMKKSVPIAIAAAIALMVIASPMMNNKNEEAVVPPAEVTEEAASRLPPPPASSPMGMRKFLIFRNSRYEFINNGEEFPETKLASPLGKLEYDIAGNPAENNKKDFATSFSLGSEIYSVEDTDSFFRIAVKAEDGKIYMAQNVASLEGDLNLEKFFTLSNLKNTAEGIDIYDHFEREVLNTVPEDEIESLIDTLSKCETAELENEDYEAIAKSQSEGRSFRLVIRLNNGPDYKLYVIPSMDIVMIGDSRLKAPTDFEIFKPLFEDLKVLPPVMN